MEKFPEVSRRIFLKMACGTVSVIVTPVSALLGSSQTSPARVRPEHWIGPPGQARRRIDGLPKVLGQKIFARDFRSRDLPGWPDATEKVATVLRAVHTDRPMLGYDLSSLAHLPPPVVVDAETLEKDLIQDLWWDSSPQGFPAGLMVSKGQTAVYAGQPVAILIFDNYEVYRQAYRLLQFNPEIIQYGPPDTTSKAYEPYNYPKYLTLYLQKTNGEYRVDFSQTKDGSTNPYATGSNATSKDKEARRFREKIENEIAEGNWRLFSGVRSTQLIVPMFMEPEAGLGWYESETGTLNVLLGTQSPDGDVADAMDLFGDPQCPFNFRQVKLISCYPGGGFGGRDMSPFVPIMMLTAVYAGGPVRIARDRFQEFQAGLVQLQSRIEQTLAVDEEGYFQAIRTVSRLPSGGKNNYSQFVAELAGYTAGGGYLFPRAIVDAWAQPTAGLVAGSMRGFGGPQAAFALETLIDEMSEELGRDPIELRRRNALKEKDRTVTGAPLSQPMRIAEICDKASRNPLWTQREAEKAKYRDSTLLYGVGFALANQAYGVGGDGVMADVEVGGDGALNVRTNAVDMGTGSATTLAIATARWLGANASHIEMGQVSIFKQLRLSSSLSGKRQASDPWQHPHYTAGFSLSSSACITAFQQVHAVRQASRVLFRTGLWPAAVSLWGANPGEDALQAARWQWRQDGSASTGRSLLMVPGQRPLDLREIAARLHEEGGVCEAMVHAYFAGDWVRAWYNVNGIEDQWAIDGLTTRQSGMKGYDWHPRFDIVPPPPNSENYGRSLYAPSAAIVSVLVDPKTGKVAVHDVYGYLDAGQVQQPDLLSGQYQGAVAMGIGYCLIENLPPGPQGGGDGTWNLNRYHVALAGDLPLERIQLELLAAESPTGKGIAEAVLCPLLPAIANAVANATGKRFNSLPITPTKIREVLRSNG